MPISLMQGAARRCRGLAIAAVAVAGLLVAAPSAEAMRVSPMVAEVTVTGAGSSARIEVGNDSASPLPYETHITQVVVDRDGKVTETPADDDFLVFPPQGLIGANSSQTIRVQWLGDPKLDASRSYFLEVRQLPVPFEAGPKGDRPEVHVQVNYRIKAMITVAPNGAKSSVSVDSVTAEMIPPPKPRLNLERSGAPPPPSEPDKPIPGLRVVLKNVGARHALMGGVNWVFDGKAPDGKPFHVIIRSGQMTEDIGIGYLPPNGGERVFDVPFDQAVSGPVSVRFTE